MLFNMQYLHLIYWLEINFKQIMKGVDDIVQGIYAHETPDIFEKMITDLEDIEDVYDQAIFLFLTMARTQFFYDVNKRMGRFMMNGWLLSKGFPAINLPAKRQLEFNQLMIKFYDSNNGERINTFLRSCLDQRIVNIMKE